MSIDPKVGRYCDGCGDTIKKAHLVFEGQDYCANCYSKTFISKPCVRCGSSARMHKHSQEEPVCRKCAAEGRTCQRCNNLIAGKAGMLSEGKPVCPSCTPYFREPRPCERCGEPSTRLSAMPQMGIHEKICDRCRNKVSCKTCSICRKFRKVAGYTDANKPYCAQCIPGQESTHSCPGCNTILPGAGNAKCRACSNEERLAKESAMLAAGMDHLWAKDLCLAFAAWLWERQKGNPTLVRTYVAHQSMFERLDATYKNVADISAESLLQDFGTATLRKHLLVRSYLEDSLLLKITASARDQTADSDRIKVKLADHSNRPWGGLLKEYASWLEGLKVSVRTRRMYIATAATFCEEIKVGSSSWKESQAERHLLRHPGAYTNLLKFVRYCSEVRGWDVVMPPQSHHLKIKSKPPATVARLKKLLDKVSAAGLDRVDAATLCRILALSFGLTVSKMREIPKDKFESDGTGLKFHVDDECVKVPMALLAIAQAHIARISSQVQ